MARVYSEEYRTERDAHREKWLMGNKDAIQFVQTLTNAAEIWDDIFDGDRDFIEGEVDNAFLGMLIELPNNEFYLQNRKFFAGLMLSAVNAWKDSEELKLSKHERLRRLAFQLRFMLFEVTKMSAFLLGGWKHLREVSPEICVFYAYEDFEEWNQENVTEFKRA